jgi:hypothetical protein
VQCWDICVYPFTHGIFSVPINLTKYAIESLAILSLNNSGIIYVVPLKPTYNLKDVYAHKNFALVYIFSNYVQVLTVRKYSE